MKELERRTVSELAKPEVATAVVVVVFLVGGETLLLLPIESDLFGPFGIVIAADIGLLMLVVIVPEAGLPEVTFDISDAIGEPEVVEIEGLFSTSLSVFTNTVCDSESELVCCRRSALNEFSDT